MTTDGASWGVGAPRPLIPSRACPAGVAAELREGAGFVVVHGGAATPYTPANEAASRLAPRTVRDRGLVLDDGSPTALARHDACERCPHLATCAPVFVAGALRTRLGAAPRARSLAPALDLATSPRALPSMLDALARRGRPAWGVVEGTVDHVRLTPTGARLVRGSGEPFDAADAAVGAGVRVASADLPARSGRPDWRLGFVPARGPLAHRRGRFATLFILRRCTASCVMCHVQEFYRGGDMPFARLCALLEELRTLGYDRVDYFGGEPTLRADLPEAVGVASALGCRIEIVTNGMTVDDALAARLRDAGLALAMVSLDGPDPAAHDAIRGVAGGWERAVRGVRALVAAGGFEVNLDTVVLPSNHRRMGEVVDLAHALGCTRLNLFLCVSAPLLAHEPMWLSPDAARAFFFEELPAARARARSLGVELSMSPAPPDETREGLDAFAALASQGVYNPVFARGGRCVAPLDEVFVTLDGDVFPCTSPSMLETEHRLGNAFEAPLSEVVGGAGHLAFCERAGAVDACRMCWRARPG